MKNIVIVGKGGLAKEVRWYIERINQIEEKWNFIGYIDRNSGPEVIGNDEYICNCEEDMAVVLAIGDNALRKCLYNMYRENSHICFPNIIDPSVIISDKVYMGEANVICINAIVTVDVTIGNGVLINEAATVGHDSVVEDFVTVGTHSLIAGGVHLGEEVLVGAGVSIMQYSNIGKNVKISMNSAVLGNVKDDVTVAGVPARVMINSRK